MKINNFFGKKILVTGHTGFKGSWLAAWLDFLGATVTGVSLDVPTSPSHFEAADLGKRIDDIRIDIRDSSGLAAIVQKLQPDYIFHLAAQPIVRLSYDDPLATWSTNVLGTVNVLDSLKQIKKHCVSIMITSDKCYENMEWEWGYRENDAVGGIDPYSASKAGAELAISSYCRAMYNDQSLIRIASARAGNVIGGGDWALDRIIPDCVRAWSNDLPVNLRSPNATRPWQHVLEPLSGYLALALKLSDDASLHGHAYNFGPPAAQNRSVVELVSEMAPHWDRVKWIIDELKDLSKHEAGLLKLNCDKSLHQLGWHAVLDFSETVMMTAEWYKNFYDDPANVYDVTISQIESYVNLAAIQKLPWATK